MKTNKEIGGYLELDRYHGKMLYDDAVLLNCGRSALLYLIRTKKIKKIVVPKFMCNSNDRIIKNEGLESRLYSIDSQFRPIDLKRADDEWLYLVNYYGQLSNEYIKTLGDNLIIDNSQAYFQSPIPNYDTFYSCRKFFGVPDGAILYTDMKMGGLTIDESYRRMNFLLGRFERSASEFYSEYVENNESFNEESLKHMSKLTNNLLHAIDYDFVAQRRTKNFCFLHERLGKINKLNVTIPKGAFMYPLYIENGDELRKKIQRSKIYVPTLWPDVFSRCKENELEYDMAKNILPIPVDQRYEDEDMEHIVDEVLKYT